MSPLVLNKLAAEKCLERREDLISNTVYVLAIIVTSATIVYFGLFQATDLSHLVGLGHKATCITFTAGGGALLALLTAGIAQQSLHFDGKLEEKYLKGLAKRMAENTPDACKEFQHLLRLSPRLYRKLLKEIHVLGEGRDNAIATLASESEAFDMHGRGLISDLDQQLNQKK